MNNLRYTSAKNIITKSKLPDADYVVNPYIGCSFGCSYCYASFMGRKVGESIANWGNYVYIKENCIKLFSEEMDKFVKKNNLGTILFSSVTDAYQPLEAKLLLTREMLEICSSYEYKGKISILTKSPLVTRDIPIIKSLKNKEVGLTISHVLNNDLLVKRMESNAPGVKARLSTLEKLNTQGIDTYAFIGPLMPHLFEEVSQVEEMFKQISNIGTKEVFVEYLNVTPYIKERIMKNIERTDNFYSFYDQLDKKSISQDAFDEIMHQYIRKYDLLLRLKKTLIH